MWDTDSDLALRVNEPSGLRINHADRWSASGGCLDLDDIPAAGDTGPHVENVFRPTGGASPGRSSASVQRYEIPGGDPCPYPLEVRVRGELVHQETGLVPMYEGTPTAYAFIRRRVGGP
ncbi:MAG: hypothetical protein ABIJ48_11910 [Actinomycetota bacterium]